MSPTICDQCQRPVSGKVRRDERGEPRCRECPPIRADGGRSVPSLDPERSDTDDLAHRVAALRADHDLLDDVVIELLERVEYLEAAIAELQGEPDRAPNARVLDPDDGTLSTNDALDVLTGEGGGEGGLADRIDELAGGPK